MLFSPLHLYLEQSSLPLKPSSKATLLCEVLPDIKEANWKELLPSCEISVVILDTCHILP